MMKQFLMIRLQPRFLRVVAVHEHICLPGMAVQVDEHKGRSTEYFNCILDEPFCVVNGWMECGRGIVPHPIQVLAGQRTAMAAIDDPVRVEHWDQLEDKQFPCPTSQRMGGEQELNQAMHNP